MTLQISLVTPRLDTKPWGGRRLERLGLTLPEDERVGEALVTANDAMVTAGDFRGQSLASVVAQDPPARLGAMGLRATSGRPVFPLLVKLIDAADHLSIQVHPDDAAAPPDRLGKTEAWHILAADPGALLFLGIQPGTPPDAFRDTARRLDGSTASLMRTVAAQEGTTVLIPAGTVHALGAGVLVYEIQQPSDVTYRLDDWGRVDDAGNPRDMHLDQGFAVTRPGLVPELIPPVALRCATGEHHLLAACRYFALERLSLPSGGQMDVGSANSPVVVTLVAGTATIAGHEVQTGASAVIWPTSERALLQASTPAIVLIAHVPDLASDVVDRGRRSGASTHALAALGGPTGDVQGAMSS